MFVCLAAALAPLMLGLLGYLFGLCRPRHRRLLRTSFAALGVLVCVGSIVFLAPRRYVAVDWVAPLLLALQLVILAQATGWPSSRRIRATAPVGAGGAVADPPDTEELASLLHDTVGQGLTAIKLNLGSATTAAERQRLQKIDVMTTHTMTELRNVITWLHDTSMPQPATETRVADVVDRFRAAGLQIQLRVSGNEEKLRQPLRSAVIRILREALSNSSKYNFNAQVDVDLRIDEEILLRVHSRAGRECAGPRTAAGFPWRSGWEGSRMMQRLAARHGGTIRMGRSGRGYRVTATLPLRHGSRTGPLDGPSGCGRGTGSPPAADRAPGSGQR